ncbi:cytochrome P450 [Mytilinidion resinicola]|uniref:Cytochrome P450 n=1 Tax=Mytilinidion resinicola TaxID=574789 RepID=A0A6A6Z2Z0_9PEZI|nr:cytochrome P450 [Mytilinidion resinicola]KAF2815188.1 cytochrome P450 [Mytilinidion resinicola]
MTSHLLSLLLTATSLGIILLLSRLLWSYLTSPIRDIPGPFLAKLTDLWRLYSHWAGTHIETQRKLHEKYGSAVRIGPNCVSISDPSLITTIYDTRGDFVKSDLYRVTDAVQDGQTVESVFSTRSNDFHSKYIKPIHKFYVMNSILKIEHFVDRTLESLCEHIEERFIERLNTGKLFDIADWIHLYTWDVMSELTFSKKMGFLETGGDVEDAIATNKFLMRYFALVGQVPTLDKWLAKNPILPFKLPTFSGAASLCAQRMFERVQNPALATHDDFLNRFLQAKVDYPDFVGDNDVVAYLMLHLLGGADTTAIILNALIYHLLRNPAAHSRLVSELTTARLPYPAPYAAASRLPYLTAVISEAIRIHPSIGNILERVVPPAGLELRDGRKIAPGTLVGVNAWTVARSKEVYGKDVDTFRPERWLQAEEEGVESYDSRVKGMRQAELAFGAGRRACMGKPFAMVELYKVVATLFGRFEIELEGPKTEWRVLKLFFVFPSGIMVRMRRAANGT